MGAVGSAFYSTSILKEISRERTLRNYKRCEADLVAGAKIKAILMGVHDTRLNLPGSNKIDRNGKIRLSQLWVTTINIRLIGVDSLLASQASALYAGNILGFMDRF